MNYIIRRLLNKDCIHRRRMEQPSSTNPARSLVSRALIKSCCMIRFWICFFCRGHLWLKCNQLRWKWWFRIHEQLQLYSSKWNCLWRKDLYLLTYSHEDIQTCSPKDRQRYWDGVTSDLPYVLEYLDRTSYEDSCWLAPLWQYKL